MSYRALYRKYRPMSFSDVVGQDHIVTTLKNELKEGKIFHAYLFTGPRGTGKTSCAKILAKAVNCLELNDGDACCGCISCKNIEDGNNLDIVEMDAASNRGIDNIRDLKNQVNYQPANSKYRVYIIDEVHMLSTEAFNALLKTLEEPPSHIVFVLATTEVHKLPATILSRCQRFDFKRIEPAVITDRVMQVASGEGLTIDQNAASLISALSDGGMRDALSMLDLCASAGSNITESDVRKNCSAAGIDYLLELTQSVKSGNTSSALRIVDRLYKNSVDMQRLTREMISHYRNLMIVKTVENPKGLVACSDDELEKLCAQSKEISLNEIVLGLKTFSETASGYGSTLTRENVEMAFVSLCNPQLIGDLESVNVRISRLEDSLKNGVEVKVTSSAENLPKEKNEPKEEPVSKPVAPNKNANAERVKEWKKVIDDLFVSSPFMASVLTDSKAYVKGEYLLIDSSNTQFLDMMRADTNVYREAVRLSAKKILGKLYKIGPYKSETDKVSNDPLDDVINKLSELEVPEKI